jgi:hypothetical protein
MSAAGSAERDGSSTHRSAAVSQAAEWMGLAATPTFAVMALQTGILDGAPTEMLCSAAHPSPLSGMIPMYLLMSVFHSSPWLKLMPRRRRFPRR